MNINFVHRKKIDLFFDMKVTQLLLHVVLLVVEVSALVSPSLLYQFRQNRPIRGSTGGGMYMSFMPGESCTGEKVTVVGATGYIGKAVVQESLKRGYHTTAVIRPGSNVDIMNWNIAKDAVKPTIKRFDVTNRKACLQSLDDSIDNRSSNRDTLFEPGSVDVVVCCLASRSGTPKEAYAIDYQASLNVAQAAQRAGARRFVLLSAYCVKSAERNDPHALQFQYAKKKMEQELADMAATSNNCFSYVAVRPTAFFKSVSGQLETVQDGGPFVIFDLGGGKTAACNPISEQDLAAALIDQAADDSHKNTHWNLGGPDGPGLDKYAQARMIFDVLGFEGKPTYIRIPIAVLHGIVNSLQWLADLIKSDKLNDAAELARIVRYYAMEDVSDSRMCIVRVTCNQTTPSPHRFFLMLEAFFVCVCVFLLKFYFQDANNFAGGKVWTNDHSTALRIHCQTRTGLRSIYIRLWYIKRPKTNFGRKCRHFQDCHGSYS